MKQKIIFQSSLPRAGSTVLQNIFAQNPNFFVTPSSPLASLVFGFRTVFTVNETRKTSGGDIYNKPFLQFCKKGIKGYVKSLTHKPYFLDKGRDWIVDPQFVTSLFPKWKMICLVRDLRDVASSFEVLHRKKSYLDSDYGNGFNVGEGINTEDRASLVFQSKPMRNILSGIKEHITVPNTVKNILFVKYEDLCADPNTTLDKIYNFLTIPSFSHNFQKIKQITKESDTHSPIAIDHTIRKKIEISKNNHINILPSHINEEIYFNYKWYFDYFGYHK